MLTLTQAVMTFPSVRIPLHGSGFPAITILPAPAIWSESTNALDVIPPIRQSLITCNLG